MREEALRLKNKIEPGRVSCYLIRTMKKLVLLLGVVTVSFGLQAGGDACSKDKATCDKSKAAACVKAQAGTCDKAKAEAKACCPAAKAAQEAAKKPAPSPKTTS